MKGYALISRPLTKLLKKGAFEWSDEAHLPFEKLKQVLISASVLAIVDFTKVFIVETNASKIGIRVILMQESHPLAFISRALGP